MALPAFNEFGDLPEGRHVVAFDDVLARFGTGSARRALLSDRLRRIRDLAVSTGQLDSLVIFGSFVSDVAEPNDVDVILVMRESFAPERCPKDALILFDHARADTELGASIFWVRPEMLLGETLDSFLSHWERKRDGRRRGILEIPP